MFDWSAYLYLPPPTSATVLLWEGDLIDVWVDNDDITTGIREVLTKFELRVTFPQTDAAT
jgi:hypothetical protein